jgi:hypothetical protein
MSRRVRTLLGLGVAALWLASPAESGEPRPAAPGTGRVVLVPVNLAVRAVAEVEPGVDPVWRALVAYLASPEQPAIALAQPDAGALWNEVMADEKKAGGGGDLYAAYRRFAKRVAEQAEYGSIVFPTLVTHSARLSGGRTADWDGVHRPIEIPGRFNDSINTFREGPIWLNRRGAQGELAAASLHVAVFSPTGELLHQGTGGLVLLQELALPEKSKSDEIEFTTVMRKNPFEAPDQLREGIAVALGR